MIKQKSKRKRQISDKSKESSQFASIEEEKITENRKVKDKTGQIFAMVLKRFVKAEDLETLMASSETLFVEFPPQIKQKSRGKMQVHHFGNHHLYLTEAREWPGTQSRPFRQWREQNCQPLKEVEDASQLHFHTSSTTSRTTPSTPLLFPPWHQHAQKESNSTSTSQIFVKGFALLCHLDLGNLLPSTFLL